MPAVVPEMTFGQKLHHILSTPELSRGILEWRPHGRAFRIVSPKGLEDSGILPYYFGHNRYDVFLEHLRKHGFRQITRGKDEGSFYHEVCLFTPLPRSLREDPLFSR
jgi:hypothetical protein